MQLSASELILNADASIYHLNIRPEDLAPTVITVGDPDRVSDVSKYFDTISVKKGKREFKTHTGTLAGKAISVVSTGIGADNIDIVLNELDALVNIDFDNRSVKETKTALDIVRIGTSGAIQAHIPIDSFLISEDAIGFDNLLHFYQSEAIQNTAVQEAFLAHTNWHKSKSTPYVVSYNAALGKRVKSHSVIPGFTATNVGFYGPQSRKLRLNLQDEDLNRKLASFSYRDKSITNLEMETSAIYGLSLLLGHRAISMNCILANRATGEFSKDPVKSVDQLIQYTLEKLVT